MKPFITLTLLSTFLCCASSSSLQAALISQSTFREPIINPPAIPFDKEWFLKGFGEGLVTPFVGVFLTIVESGMFFKAVSKYQTFKNNPAETARLSWGHLFLNNDPKLDDFVGAYVTLRRSIASGDHVDIHNKLNACNNIIREHRTDLKDFDVTQSHNHELRYCTRFVSEPLGILIGSTISTFGVIYFLSTLLFDKKDIKPEQMGSLLCVDDLD